MTQKFQETMQQLTAKVGESVREIRKEDSLVFLTFSDLHTKAVESEFVEKLLLALKTADSELSPDFVIDLGDNTGMLGRENHITNEDLTDLLKKLFGSMQSAVSCPLLLVHGNHDAPGTDFYKPDFWNNIVKGHYGHEAAVYGEKGSYCYLDVPNAKTRLVILSMPFDSDIESPIPTPCWKFGDAQLRWLANEALDTPYSVILLPHVPLYYDYRGDTKSMLGVWTGERPAKSYIKDLCGEIADRDTAVAILTAFQNHEAYMDHALGISMKASVNSASLAACFSGHIHKDSLWQPGEVRESYKNPLPCTQVVTTAAFLSWEEKQIGISMDVVVWTPSERKFHIFRIGDGENRTFDV